jgi:hygromycin-B 4-O-kinase
VAHYAGIHPSLTEAHRVGSSESITGTRGVDRFQAETFLRDRFGSGVADVAPIGQGEWSRAFAFRLGDAGYVARFGAFGDDFAKDRLAAGYASTDLPIPAVIDVGEALGGYYAISERAFGRYLDDLDGAELRATMPSLFAALDAARFVDLSGTTGYGIWGGDGAAPYRSWRDALADVAADRPGDRIQGWRERLAASPVGTGPFDESLARLHQLLDRCPEERHLIHADLLHFNVLVAGNRVTAVVDWGCAMYGDFLYDLAWFAFWSPWYPAWAGIDFRQEATRHYAAIGLEVPELAERLRCHQLHIGLDSLKYNAFTGRWGNLETVARQALELARGRD